MPPVLNPALMARGLGGPGPMGPGPGPAGPPPGPGAMPPAGPGGPGGPGGSSLDLVMALLQEINGKMDKMLAGEDKELATQGVSDMENPMEDNAPDEEEE